MTNELEPKPTVNADDIIEPVLDAVKAHFDQYPTRRVLQIPRTEIMLLEIFEGVVRCAGSDVPEEEINRSIVSWHESIVSGTYSTTVEVSFDDHLERVKRIGAYANAVIEYDAALEAELPANPTPRRTARLRGDAL